MAKRITCLLLVILLLAGMVPAASAAEITDEADVKTAPEATGETEVAETEYTGDDLIDTGIIERTGYSIIDPCYGIALMADTGNMNWYGMYQIQTQNREINYFTYTTATGKSITANLRTITRMYMDGVVAYCIRPGTSVVDGGSYTENEQIDEWNTYLSDAQRKAIAMVVALGYPMKTFTDGADNGIYASYGSTKSEWQTSERFAATQILIWEFLMGYRSAEYPYTLDATKTSTIGRTLLETFYSASDSEAKWPTLIKVYNEILDAVKNAGVYPSFMAESNSKAQTVELVYNASSGKYEASLTDTNKVLSNYTFSCSNSGVTLTKSGNTLKISATADAAAAMSANAVTVTATGTALNIDPEKVVTVWYAPSGSQEVITPVQGTVSALTVYLKLTAQASGDLKIVKTSSSGNVSSFNFKVEGEGISKTVTSGSDGTITVEGLTPGTYTVTEVLSSSSGYYCTSINPQTVTVQAGKTATVTFNNELKQWCVTVYKEDAETGTAQADATLDGAVYGLYKDGVLVKEYTVQNGTFTTDSYPCGTGYTLKEISAPVGYQLDGTIYKLDDYSKTTSCSGALTTAQVTVLEDVISGWFQITKRTKNPVSGATAAEFGATFRYYLKSAGSFDSCADAYKGTLTTNASGVATSKELPYGTYVVEQTSGAAGTDMVESFEITISEHSKTYTYTKDNPYWTGTVSIVKYEAGTTTPLTAKFHLLDKDKNVLETGTTGAEGELTFGTLLVYGQTYYIQEAEAVEGYELDTTVHPVTVESRNQAVSLTLENDPQEGSIRIKKLDAQGNTMSGIKFLLEYSTDGKNWKPVTSRSQGSNVTTGGCTSSGLSNGILTTDQSGVEEFTGLRVSSLTGMVYYRLTEVSTRDSSTMMIETVYEDKLTAGDSKDITVTAVNGGTFELPHTGSIDMTILHFGQLLCIVACGSLLLFGRKKEQ